ncbi:MAG: sigma-70 family RNA polymerase sigma factor [Verrucomicrobiae bacterium]|nr:sigma-70 family RNA polymerase sigma factor [Verrucomicrobiae bacterium]
MTESSSTKGTPARETTGKALENEKEIVLQAQAGEMKAFDRLVEAYRNRVYGVLYNMIGNNEDAADLCQDVFIKAYKSIGSYRHESAFYTWLDRITINTAINFIRLRKESNLSLDEFSSDIEENVTFKELRSKESVQKDIQCEEIKKFLNEALQKLSKDHRAVVVLHDIEGLPHQEVAKTLGCTEATARSRLFYAHQELKAILAKYL